MMDENHREQILFEIYKLHTEITERTVQRREGINTVLSTIVVSILTANVLIYRLTPDSRMVWFLLVLGVFVSAAWSLSLVSMTARIMAKRQILTTIERKIPFSFLTKEITEFKKSSGIRRKISEQIFPLALGTCCIGSLAFELVKWWQNNPLGM